MNVAAVAANGHEFRCFKWLKQDEKGGVLMKRISSMAVAGALLGAVVWCAPVSGTETFGAGRNGADGKADPWASYERAVGDPVGHTATEVLGAGRRGADGMADPWYTGEPARTGAGDAPADNFVPNPH
jgi:hypothetical protein